LEYEIKHHLDKIGQKIYYKKPKIWTLKISSLKTEKN